jgi:hypothetical protein
MTTPDVFAFIPTWLLGSLHFIGGLVVLAEALNKLERIDIFAHGLCIHLRIVALLKLLGWMLLGIGAAGALITPLLHLQAPTLQDVAVIFGFAILIIRSRLKE